MNILDREFGIWRPRNMSRAVLIECLRELGWIQVWEVWPDER